MALTKRWKQHIDLRHNSGLTQAGYCQQEGLNRKTFSARLSEYRSRRSPRPPVLIPIQVKSSCTMPKATGWNCRHPCRFPGWASCLGVWTNTEPRPDLAGRSAGRYTHGAQVRRGIDGLSMIVEQSLGQSPCAGSVFVFRNRPGNRLRLLVWDGNGVWLCHRRLHRGCFVWPKVNAPCFSISEAQWQWLVAGVDWQRLSAVPQAHWQA
jgi:transposase